MQYIVVKLTFKSQYQFPSINTGQTLLYMSSSSEDTLEYNVKKADSLKWVELSEAFQWSDSVSMAVNGSFTINFTGEKCGQCCLIYHVLSCKELQKYKA